MDAQRSKLGHFGDDAVDVVDHQAFRHFQREMGGIGAGERQQVAQRLHESGLAEMTGTDVHGNSYRHIRDALHG